MIGNGPIGFCSESTLGRTPDSYSLTNSRLHRESVTIRCVNTRMWEIRVHLSCRDYDCSLQNLTFLGTSSYHFLIGNFIFQVASTIMFWNYDPYPPVVHVYCPKGTRPIFTGRCNISRYREDPDIIILFTHWLHRSSTQHLRSNKYKSWWCSKLKEHFLSDIHPT